MFCSKKTKNLRAHGNFSRVILIVLLDILTEDVLYLPDYPPTGNGCYIYHGIYGTCKYVCDPDEEKMYGMGECEGAICCYHGYPQQEQQE